jgi:molybdopterin-guanine dinucleotide biosynthesis protein A
LKGTPPPSRDRITGVVLAGGMARRMGGRDKGLVQFADRPLVEWAIEAVAPQVSRLLINANRNREIYAAYGLPVVADEIGGFQGPLAGFASAMAAADTPWLLTVPCDGPFPPPDLAERLCAALIAEDAEIAVAAENGRMQPVYALIPVALADRLQAFLAAGERKIDRWYARHKTVLADFGDRPGCFANINSDEDSAALAKTIAP